MEIIRGFSKLGREQKIALIEKQSAHSVAVGNALNASREDPNSHNSIVEKLSENYVGNHVLPYGIVPNVLVNDTLYFVPMVTEESSVVAAASYAARFWAEHGGFQVNIPGTKKSGQVYFSWQGHFSSLLEKEALLKKALLTATQNITAKMVKRGGGITGIQLLDADNTENNFYTLDVEFETIDSMGANFINSCLEAMGSELSAFTGKHFPDHPEAEVIMAILSNYTPGCVAECSVSCDTDDLKHVSGGLSPEQFAAKFKTAVDIARSDTKRAVTHNKGIFNGIDAVLLATGNDYRAVEAGAHAYASKDGKYRSLTEIELSGSEFRYTLKVPLAVGTVGGITSIHPMARTSMEILQQPSAEELMKIIAAIGMASNFAAVRSLVTDGIQKGHMKLHLDNILTGLKATDAESARVKEYFRDKQVSHQAVSEYLEKIKNSI